MNLKDLIQYAEELKYEGAGISEFLECFNEMLTRLKNCDNSIHNQDLSTFLKKINK